MLWNSLSPLAVIVFMFKFCWILQVQKFPISLSTNFDYSTSPQSMYFAKSQNTENIQSPHRADINVLLWSIHIFSSVSSTLSFLAPVVILQIHPKFLKTNT